MPILHVHADFSSLWVCVYLNTQNVYITTIPKVIFTLEDFDFVLRHTLYKDVIDSTGVVIELEVLGIKLLNVNVTNV